MDKSSKPKPNISNSKNTKISKLLALLLRHQADQFGLKIDSRGFVVLDELLKSKPIKDLKVGKDQIYEIVEKDTKGRYEITESPVPMIRAVQGHSMTAVKDEDILDPIEMSDIFRYPVVVHGTYYEAWEFIKTSGLNKMSRNCIHFSVGFKKDEHVKSGMRNDCQILVEINAVQALHSEEMKFFISKNKVVLTPGTNGVLPTKYFEKVTDNKGTILHSQNYEIAVYLKFENSCIKIVLIIDITNGQLIKKIESSDIYQISSTISELKDVLKRPMIMIIEKNKEKNYIELIKSNIFKHSFMGMFVKYIPLTFSSENNEDVIKEM